MGGNYDSAWPGAGLASTARPEGRSLHSLQVCSCLLCQAVRALAAGGDVLHACLSYCYGGSISSSMLKLGC